MSLIETIPAYTPLYSAPFGPISMAGYQLSNLAPVPAIFYQTVLPVRKSSAVQ